MGKVSNQKNVVFFVALSVCSGNSFEKGSFLMYYELTFPKAKLQVHVHSFDKIDKCSREWNTSLPHLSKQTV